MIKDNLKLVHVPKRQLPVTIKDLYERQLQAKVIRMKKLAHKQRGKQTPEVPEPKRESVNAYEAAVDIVDLLLNNVAELTKAQFAFEKCHDETLRRTTKEMIPSIVIKTNMVGVPMYKNDMAISPPNNEPETTPRDNFEKPDNMTIREKDLLRWHIEQQLHRTPTRRKKSSLLLRRASTLNLSPAYGSSARRNTQGSNSPEKKRSSLLKNEVEQVPLNLPRKQVPRADHLTDIKVDFLRTQVQKKESNFKKNNIMRKQKQMGRKVSLLSRPVQVVTDNSKYVFKTNGQAVEVGGEPELPENWRFMPDKYQKVKYREGRETIVEKNRPRDLPIVAQNLQHLIMMNLQSEFHKIAVNSKVKKKVTVGHHDLSLEDEDTKQQESSEFEHTQSFNSSKMLQWMPRQKRKKLNEMSNYMLHVNSNMVPSHRVTLTECGAHGVWKQKQGKAPLETKPSKSVQMQSTSREKEEPSIRSREVVVPKIPLSHRSSTRDRCQTQIDPIRYTWVTPALGRNPRDELHL